MDFTDWPDSVFAAYVAGFTDGEGWIGTPSSPHGSCVARIILANCVPEVLRAIQQRLGYGSIKSQKQRENWRERFVLDIANSRDAEAFLCLVRPYLFVKAEAADKALTVIAAYRKRTEARHLRNEEIRMAAANGEMRKLIAARFGVSPQTVSRLLEGHNWPSERSRYARGRTRRSDGTFTPVHLTPQ